MLKGIDPLLTGRLLKILDEMGHGDQLLLVDRNYPAASTGRPVVRLGEVGVVRTMAAILSVFPLDEFVEHPLERMEVDGDAARTTPEQDAVLHLARSAHPRPIEWGVGAASELLRKSARRLRGRPHPRAAALGVLHPHEGRRLSGLRRVTQ